MKKDRLIMWLIGVSAVSCLLWLGGLVWSFQTYSADSVKKPVAASPAIIEATPDSSDMQDQFHLLALGDSLTKGTGDSSGKGYVGYLIEHLEKRTEQEIILNNYGVDGQTSNQLAEEVKLSPIKDDLKAADVIVLSIGGNDLFLGGDTMGNLEPTNIKQIEKDFLLQLDSILKQLREGNESVRIFVIGLYNPFNDLQDAARTNQIIRDWNYQVSELISQYSRIVLVPTADIFQLKVQEYLARDLFHPNAAGYQLMGDRLAALITW